MKYAVISEQGRRSEQQDTYSVVERDGCLFMGIFDGHGGREAAEFARRELPEVLFDRLDAGASIQDSLKHAFIEIDRRTHEAELPSGMTATVALYKNKRLCLAHVGDSRAILIRDGQFKQLTKDHKITDPEEMSRYRASVWFKEKSRLVSQGKVKGFKLTTVSRSLGDAFFEDAISAVPDITQIELQVGDLLIIATDGLWHFVQDEQVLALTSKDASVEHIASTLVSRALSNAGTDNVTVGAIRV